MLGKNVEVVRGVAFAVTGRGKGVAGGLVTVLIIPIGLTGQAEVQGAT